MNRFFKSMIKLYFPKIISALPGGKRYLPKYIYLIEQLAYSRKGNAEEIFSHYYKTNAWNNNESVSGDASTIKYTENIRRMLPLLAKDLNISVILDAPCGDYNWFSKIEWEDEITYIGGDIVKPLIENNQSLYGSQIKTFKYLDITQDPLPNADLWLCRDCFFHLSNRDVMLAIDNFLRSEIPYLLTTTHPNCDINQNIPSGSFRHLNFELPPFDFPTPQRTIDDWIEGWPVRHLALWERDVLLSHVASNKEFQRVVRNRN